MNYRTTAFDLKLALLQYFRFKRQWVCVDEFEGADIIVDTGKEIIEIEVKVTKPDLINGEKAKVFKHQIYRHGGQFAWNRPNKFLFCVPEKLVDIALGWSNEINERYGVIGFDVERFEKCIAANFIPWGCNYIRIVKSAKKLHDKYSEDLRYAIAKKTSAKIAVLLEKQFKEILAERKGKCK